MTRFLLQHLPDTCLDRGQEGAEQFLENLGIQRGTGAEVDLTTGVTNAMYQGVVVQGGVQALGDGANLAGRGIESLKTQLQSEEDPVAMLLRARNANIDSVLADVRTQFGPDATIASIFDNIPQQNELTLGQRRQLSRTGAIEVNGRRVTRAQIETASDPANRQALAILQFGTPDTDNNVSLNFEKIDNLELAAKTFGIAPLRVRMPRTQVAPRRVQRGARARASRKRAGRRTSCHKIAKTLT